MLALVVDGRAAEVGHVLVQPSDEQLEKSRVHGARERVARVVALRAGERQRV